MISITDNLKLMLGKVIRIKPGQSLLVVTDTYARSKSIAQTVTDLANSMGIQTVMAMMEPRIYSGQEPPPSVSAAMKVVDVVFEVGEKSNIAHTNARKEATAAGAKYFVLHTDVSEDYLRNPISFENLNIIKRTTEKLAEMVTRAKIARVTTHYGTDITMSLKGRQAVPIHPLTEAGIAAIPDYAEVAISPVEGTTEGVVAVDASVRGWGYILREPIRFKVKKGRAQVETVSSDITEDAERFKKLLLFDENASNCAAELGLGTSHTVPKTLRGDFVYDFALAGNVHIAVGRNNDIGGETFSKIHYDVLMTRATVKLDDLCVIENGELKI